MGFESTAFYEAGYGAVWLLSENILGAPLLISALPDGNHQGFVMPSHDAPNDLSPEAVRAFGRAVVAGAMAQMLSGFGAVDSGSDTEKLAELARLTGRGDSFAQECADGAEWMLRLHWGGVEAIASALHARDGSLVGPGGIELARTMLHLEPKRSLGLDDETIMRLAPKLLNVPELAGPIEKALTKFIPYYLPTLKGNARKRRGVKPPSKREAM
jgi:hypothetical protein